MKRIAQPEPEIRRMPVSLRPRRGLKGLWWRAAEDPASGDVIVSIEYCGQNQKAIVAAMQLLDKIHFRLDQRRTRR